MATSVAFASLALSPLTVRGVESFAPKPLSPIEAKAIPALLRGQAIIAVSPTGTGKTWSYLIPIVDGIARLGAKEGQTQAIVVVPTVVLGFQIRQTLLTLLAAMGLKDRKVSFFQSPREISDSRKDPEVAIVTPPLFGELLKHLDLSAVKRVVFDEGDMILFDGFLGEMEKACASLPKAKKSFFSASLGPQYLKAVKRLCQADAVFDLSNGTINGSNITHVLVDLRGFDREQGLLRLLAQKDLVRGQGIVFVAKREELRTVGQDLMSAHIPYAVAEGGLDKGALERNVKDFAKGEVPILLASDYASRGLDLPSVSFVVSYTLPENGDYYFHRAGRSGRFDRKGTSFVLFAKDDLAKVRSLQRRGAGFSFYAVKKDGVVPVASKPKDRPYRDYDLPYVKQAVIKAKIKYPKGRVKPGYKKKIRTAIAIAKNKHKDKIIRTNLRKKDLTHGI